MVLSAEPAAITADGFSTTTITVRISRAADERFRDVIFTTTNGEFGASTTDDPRRIVRCRRHERRGKGDVARGATGGQRDRDGGDSGWSSRQSRTHHRSAVPADPGIGLDLHRGRENARARGRRVGDRYRCHDHRRRPTGRPRGALLHHARFVLRESLVASIEGPAHRQQQCGPGRSHQSTRGGLCARVRAVQREAVWRHGSVRAGLCPTALPSRCLAACR